MSEEFEDLLIEFDEMGFEPTTLCGNPQEEVKSFRNKLEQALLKAEKLEKAWEIVKEKDVDMYSLKRCKTVEEYNIEYQQLTEEEFELIKEMLE